MSAAVRASPGCAGARRDEGVASATAEPDGLPSGAEAVRSRGIERASRIMVSTVGSA